MSTDQDNVLRGRVEYRFFWPHAHDEMNGARPRTKRPTLEEIAEWSEDMARFWVERRVIYEGSWERDPEFDQEQIAALMLDGAVLDKERPS